MNRQELLEALPHYAAIVILFVLVLWAVRATIGDVSLWVELAIVVVVAFGYPIVVRQLGVAPSVWE